MAPERARGAHTGKEDWHFLEISKSRNWIFLIPRRSAYVTETPRPRGSVYVANAFCGGDFTMASKTIWRFWRISSEFELGF